MKDNKTTTETTLPPYVTNAQQNLLNAGTAMTAPFLQTAQYAVAGFNPDQTMAFDGARNMYANSFGMGGQQQPAASGAGQAPVYMMGANGYTGQQQSPGGAGGLGGGGGGQNVTRASDGGISPSENRNGVGQQALTPYTLTPQQQPALTQNAPGTPTPQQYQLMAADLARQNELAMQASGARPTTPTQPYANPNYQPGVTRASDGGISPSENRNGVGLYPNSPGAQRLAQGTSPTSTATGSGNGFLQPNVPGAMAAPTAQTPINLAQWTSAGPANQSQFVPFSNVSQAPMYSAGQAAQANAFGTGTGLASGGGGGGGPGRAEAAAMGPAAQSAMVNANAAQLDPNAYRAFMDPYTSDVIDTSLARMDRSFAEQNAARNARYSAAGSFGGSGSAVADILASREHDMNTGQLAAQLRSQGFNQATNTALQNTGFQQAANLQNSQLGTQNNQFNAGQSNELTGLGAQLGTQASIANANNQTSAGIAAGNNSTSASIANAGNMLSQALANMGAQNNMSQFNATLGSNIGMFNAGQQNTAGMQNSALQNALNQFNTGQWNNMGQFNTGQQNNMSLQNALMANSGGQFNANNLLAAYGLQNQLNQGQFGMQQQSLANLLGIGNQQQGLAQQNLNVPWDMLARLQSVTPGGTASTTTQTQPTNVLGNLLGLGLSIGGMPAAGGGSLLGNYLS